MATHEIRIDRNLSLAAEPHTGHNRWQPDIPCILRCEPGDQVVLAPAGSGRGRRAAAP